MNELPLRSGRGQSVRARSRSREEVERNRAAAKPISPPKMSIGQLRVAERQPRRAYNAADMSGGELNPASCSLSTADQARVWLCARYACFQGITSI